LIEVVRKLKSLMVRVMGKGIVMYLLLQIRELDMIAELKDGIRSEFAKEKDNWNDGKIKIHCWP
jgi:hypothetical protein